MGAVIRVLLVLQGSQGRGQGEEEQDEEEEEEEKDGGLGQHDILFFWHVVWP